MSLRFFSDQCVPAEITEILRRQGLRADFEKLGRVHAPNAKCLKPIDLVGRLIELGDATVHNAFHCEVLPTYKPSASSQRTNFK